MLCYILNFDFNFTLKPIILFSNDSKLFKYFVEKIAKVKPSILYLNNTLVASNYNI